MRNLLVGVVIGLLIGALGAFGYTHFMGEGKQLVQVQAQLDTAQSTLTKNTDDDKLLHSEADALSAQVQQLSSRNEELKHQVEDLKQNPVGDTGGAKPNLIAGFMKTAVANQYLQKLQLLKSRLHLTPEQEARLKAAMDEESQHATDMANQMLAGGKIDPNDAKNMMSVEKTLQDMLTPDQKTEYKQMQADEKSSQAETMATVEMNQVAPLLQLNDTQKDQVYNAIYQSNANAQDPAWIKNNMPSGSNGTSLLDAEAKAKEDALSKILMPDQMTIYHQQAQSQLDMQKAMMQKFSMPASGAAASTSVIVAPGP